MNQNFKNILSKSRRDRANIYKKEFFDVSIHCLFSILPAHSYVLSYRSPCLADQIALSGNNLNWKEFDDSTSTALLRWIYTDKVVLSDLTDPEQWLDLLHGSYKLQLFPLFTICEQTLLSLIDSYPLQRFYDVAKKCGADQLLEKYSQLRLKAPSISSENGQYQDRNRDIEIYTDDDCSETRMSLDAEEEEEEEQSQSDERDELLQYYKFNLGHSDFKQFSDVKVTTNSGVLYGHAHVLESRSKKFLKEFKQTTEGGRTMRYEGPSGTEKKFFRWIYTDRVEFSKRTKIITLLRCAQYYKLSALCEQCEREIIKKIDLTTCVRYHKFAEKHNAPIILEFCNRLITEYYPKPKSLECLTNGMDVEEMDEMESDSLNEMMDLATGRPTDGFLMLNDDCLLHIFRSLSPVNLASIKATCKKLSPLADQAFRLYHDKSLEIKEATMFADIWILMHFGKYIKSLELNKIYERYASLDNIVEMIARYTGGGQLKSISLNERNEMGNESFESLKRLKTVLKNIEHIEMIELDEMVDTLLSYCENLKEVTFMGECVQLKCFWYQKNPNITKMRLVGLSNDEMLEQIFENLTRLQYLTLYLIRTETGEIIHLSRLSSTLKSLEVDGKLPYIGRALQQFPDKTVLNSINLFYVHMTELLANTLGDFPNLSNLKFSRGANFPGGVRSILSKKLVNIKHLKFNYCDEVTFKEIVEIVENLLDLRTLSVIGCDEIDYIDGQDYLRLHKIRNLKFVVDSFTYKRSAEELLKNSLDNVKLEQVDYDYNNYYEPL